MKPRFFLSTKFVCQNIRIVFSTDSVPRYDISRPRVVPEIFFLSRHVLLSEEFSGGAFGSGVRSNEKLCISPILPRFWRVVYSSVQIFVIQTYCIV